jgi:hypothetical protein
MECPPPQVEGAPGPSKNDRQTALGESAEEERGSTGAPESTEPPPTKRLRRRKLRKKATEDEGQMWEAARQDAWLRELLTDSSGSESEEKYSRFPESGRWIAEMTGGRDKKCRKREESVKVGTSALVTTTSRGECSGP